jgi:hypothetical protein
MGKSYKISAENAAEIKEYRKCHRSPKLSSKSERILSRADTLICQAQAPYFVKAKAA